MRSRSTLRNVLPGITLAVALSFSAAPAHAGFFGSIFNAAKSLFVSSAPAPELVTPMKDNQVLTSADAANAKTSEPKFTVEGFVIRNSLAFIEKQSGAFSSNKLRSSARVQAMKVANVNTDTHTRIVADYSNSGLTFTLQYDDQALQDPKLLLKDIATLEVITVGRTRGYSQYVESTAFRINLPQALQEELVSPHTIAEMLTNSQQGSPTAKARWNALQISVLSSISITEEMVNKLNLSGNVLEDIKQDLMVKGEQLNAKALEFAKAQQKSLDKWKSQTGTLDKYEAMDQKLNDLILNNDRKGVRQMLESYLPWAVMEPTEANAWKLWLDAIENPSATKTTVAFRGLKYDTDKIQRRQTPNGEIFGFMSTVLTKNQGNYTRRLRSLSTNREKNGDIGFAAHGSLVRTTKITDQMTAHAINPVASSFLSFTYDPTVAKRFAGGDIEKTIDGEKVMVPYGGLLVVKMDSRRMIPNIASMYSGEIELLAPLIVFPDEVVEYKEGAFKAGEFDKFVKDVSDKTGIDFVKWSKESTEQNLTTRYSTEGHDFLKQMIAIKGGVMSCSKVLAD